MKKSNKSTTSETRVAAIKSDGLAYTLFTPAGASDVSKFKVKSRSPMIKPGAFPLGMQLRGVIKRLITCEVQPAVAAAKGKEAVPAKYGNLIEIVPLGGTVGAAVPTVATIKTALEIIGEGDDAVCPFIGYEVVLERLDGRIPSKRGNDAWNFIVALGEKVS
jgi:hypothetical protein